MQANIDRSDEIVAGSRQRRSVHRRSSCAISRSVSGDVIAVDDLTFEVRPGRVTGFLGPNGAGKSTTLRMILGPRRTRPREPRRCGACRTRTWMIRRGRSAPCSRRRASTRFAAAGTTCGCSPRPPAIDDERVEAGARTGRPVDGREAQGRQVFAGDAATARAGGRAARRSRDPDPGRTRQRPGPARDPVAPRFPAGASPPRGNAVLVSSHQLGEMEQMADEAVVIHRGRLVRQASMARSRAGGYEEPRGRVPRHDDGEEIR